jgi:RNA polymerase sigma-B factor
MLKSTPGTLKLETLRLLQAYRKSRSTRLRNRIIEINLGLVKKEANRWLEKCHESYEDLVQVGSLGLIRAIERFETEKGYAFSSFAIPYIRGEIQHYLRDKSHPVRIPRRYLELGHKATSIQHHFHKQYHRNITDREMAQTLEIPLKEWQAVQLAWQNREPLSLDMSIDNEEEGRISLGDLIPETRYGHFQLYHEDRLVLQQAIAKLEDKTRSILNFVFFQELSQKEVAAHLGMSAVTVSRHVKKGIELLKRSMLQECA